MISTTLGSCNPKSPFLSGNLCLFQVQPPQLAALPKERIAHRRGMIGGANSFVLIQCTLVGCLFGLVSLLNSSSEDTSFSLHRSLAEISVNNSHRRQNGLQLRGNDSLLMKETENPGNYVPISCPGVLEQVKTKALPVRDPNEGVLYGRRVKRTPAFWVSLHNRNFDSTRWNIMESGDYYERALSASFEEILQNSPHGSRVLDVGGNIGYFSLLSASNGPVIVGKLEHSRIQQAKI